ncbi:MAG: DUF2490 domain-containing protein [Candidatus Marinimicrobia bacterium]|nr:DUF2490 domain-containing protein [Candidatus Neomarinimicrobiota bacterium]
MGSSSNSIYILIFSLFLISIIHSEIVENQQWMNIEISKNISQNIEIDLSQEIRYKSNYDEFSKTFTDLSLSYKIFSSIKFIGQYRYIIYTDKEKKRLSFSTKYYKQLYNFNLSYKLKIQRDYEMDKSPEDNFRNKLKIKYPINLFITPFISYELFQTIEDEKFSEDKYRASTGLEIDIYSNQSIELFYTFNGEYKDSGIEGSHITGLSYKYSF